MHSSGKVWIPVIGLQRGTGDVEICYILPAALKLFFSDKSCLHMKKKSWDTAELLLGTMQSYFMETRFMGKLLGTVKILKNRQNEIFEDWVTDWRLAADAKVIVVQHVKVKYNSLQYYNQSDVSSVCLGFAVDDLYITYIGIQSSSVWVVCRCIYSFSSLPSPILL